MKIRSAECLLFVAIVTSAVVAQIRERTLSAQTNVPTHAGTSTTAQSGRMQSCEDDHGTMLRAACAMRGERRPVDDGDRPVEVIEKPHASQLWV
ncbi:hypothetical protein V4C53_31045 [Paraburkholderia azotifigens]|uniref:hypothetical protein n=1 Tax=Paraburkholderia azotifigens TaxID=2057004 RepID=UPI00048D380C